jgi:uncharacterized protein DUF4166
LTLLTPLYERLAGTNWEQVDPVVRAIHLNADTLRAEGLFQITHGKSFLARLINWIAGMPPASHAEPITLTIERVGQGEQWTRLFGKRRLVSFQEERVGTIVAESFGPLELCFSLSTADGGIVYHQHSAALRFGTLRLRLPGWIAPKVIASEKVAQNRDSSYVSISVSLPMIGLLLGYQGELSGQGAP